MKQRRAGTMRPQCWGGSIFLSLAGVVFIAWWNAPVSWVAVLAAAAVLALVYLSARQYRRKVHEKVRKLEELNHLHLATVQALAEAIEAKDAATNGHVERVKIYGRFLARLVGLSEREIRAIEAGALLHDIGNLAVPDYILHKPGPLTPAEFEKIKSHPIVGAEMLSQVNFPYPVVPVVRHHHERWDGQGYPDGLKGEQIPITARILSVVDSFDSVRTSRHYRQALSREQAIEVLKQGAGSLYDPQLVALFLEHLPQFEAEIEARKVHACGPEAASVSCPLSAVRPPLEAERTDHEPSAILSHTWIAQAHRESLKLYEIARLLGSSLSLKETLAALLACLKELVPVTTSLVLLPEKSCDRLKVVCASGRDAALLEGRTMDMRAGIVGWVYAYGQPRFNLPPCFDLDALGGEVRSDLRASAVVPLRTDQQLLGVLALYSSELEQYCGEHLRLLEAFARLASDAFARALHHEEVEASAFTDHLTGLPNARALAEAFEREAAYARRHQEPFTVLMMDLDHFKQINDTLGHLAGDLYLIAISQAIHALLRAGDILGRYAGDEFIAILPRTRKAEVAELMKRIKSAVSNFVLKGEEGASLSAGISIGEAEFGCEGTTLDELLAVADARMYAAKAAHRPGGAQDGGSRRLFPEGWNPYLTSQTPHPAIGSAPISRSD